MLRLHVNVSWLRRLNAYENILHCVLDCKEKKKKKRKKNQEKTVQVEKKKVTRKKCTARGATNFLHSSQPTKWYWKRDRLEHWQKSSDCYARAEGNKTATLHTVKLCLSLLSIDSFNKLAKKRTGLQSIACKSGCL